MAAGGDAPTAAGPVASTPEEEKKVEFVSFVLDDAQQTWDKLFQARGKPYEHAKLVLFRDAIQSACGYAEAASGPFYCPGDEQGLHRPRLLTTSCSSASAPPATSPQAYVLAHELGHHVQRALGTEAQVRRAAAEPARRSPTSSRSGSSCRPTATPASGATRPRSARSSSPGDVEEGLGPRPRSATTASSGCRGRACTPRDSLTARRSSARAGSAAASSPAAPRTATPSRADA